MTQRKEIGPPRHVPHAHLQWNMYFKLFHNSPPPIIELIPLIFPNIKQMNTHTSPPPTIHPFHRPNMVRLPRFFFNWRGGSRVIQYFYWHLH